MMYYLFKVKSAYPCIKSVKLITRSYISRPKYELSVSSHKNYINSAEEDHTINKKNYVTHSDIHKLYLDSLLMSKVDKNTFYYESLAKLPLGLKNVHTFLEHMQTSGCNMDYEKIRILLNDRELPAEEILLKCNLRKDIEENNLDKLFMRIRESNVKVMNADIRFCSMILYAYVRKGSSEDVISLKTMMETRKFWPSRIAYSHILMAYADMGNEDMFIKTLKELNSCTKISEGKPSKLTLVELMSMYKKLIYSPSMNTNCKNLIYEELEKFKFRTIDHSLVITMFELIDSGHINETIRLMKFLQSQFDFNMPFIEDLLKFSLKKGISQEKFSNILSAINGNLPVKRIFMQFEVSHYPTLYRTFKSKEANFDFYAEDYILSKCIKSTEFDILKQLIDIDPSLVDRSREKIATYLKDINFSPTEGLKIFNVKEGKEKRLIVSLFFKYFEDSPIYHIEKLANELFDSKVLPTSYAIVGERHLKEVLSNIFRRDPKTCQLLKEDGDIMKLLNILCSSLLSKNASETGDAVIKAQLKRNCTIDGKQKEMDLIIRALSGFKYKGSENTLDLLKSFNILPKNIAKIRNNDGKQKNKSFDQAWDNMISSGNFGEFIEKISKKRIVSLEDTLFVIKVAENMKNLSIKPQYDALVEMYDIVSQKASADNVTEVSQAVLQCLYISEDKSHFINIFENILKSNSSILMIDELVGKYIEINPDNHLNNLSNILMTSKYPLYLKAKLMCYLQETYSKKINDSMGSNLPASVLKPYFKDNFLKSMKTMEKLIKNNLSNLNFNHAVSIANWCADLGVILSRNTKSIINCYPFISQNQEPISLTLLKNPYFHKSLLDFDEYQRIFSLVDENSLKKTYNQMGAFISVECEKFIENNQNISKDIRASSLSFLYYIINLTVSLHSNQRNYPAVVYEISKSMLQHIPSQNKCIAMLNYLLNAFKFQPALRNTVLLSAIQSDIPMVKKWVDVKISEDPMLKASISSTALKLGEINSEENSWNYDLTSNLLKNTLPLEHIHPIVQFFASNELIKNEEILQSISEISAFNSNLLRNLLEKYEHDRDFCSALSNKVLSILSKNVYQSMPVSVLETMKRYKLDANNLVFVSALMKTENSVSKLPLKKLIPNKLWHHMDKHALHIVINALKNIENSELGIFMHSLYLKRGKNIIKDIFNEAIVLEEKALVESLNLICAPLFPNNWIESFLAISKFKNHDNISPVEALLINSINDVKLNLSDTKPSIILPRGMKDMSKFDNSQIADIIMKTDKRSKEFFSIGRNLLKIYGRGRTSQILSWLVSAGEVEKVTAILQLLPKDFSKTKYPYICFAKCIAEMKEGNANSSVRKNLDSAMKYKDEDVALCLIGRHFEYMVRECPLENVDSLLQLSHYVIHLNYYFARRIVAGLVMRGVIDGKEPSVEQKITAIANIKNESLTEFFTALQLNSEGLCLPARYFVGSSIFPLSRTDFYNVLSYVNLKQPSSLKFVGDLALRNLVLYCKRTSKNGDVLSDVLSPWNSNDLTKEIDIGSICDSSTLNEMWTIMQRKNLKLPEHIELSIKKALIKQNLYIDSVN